MKREIQGKYVTISSVGEKAEAFVPNALPPKPEIEWSSDLRIKFENAHLALGRLDSVSVLLPDTSLFLYMYIRKEAVLSSMIEGTQSSLSDLLKFEVEQKPGVPEDDVQEVSNYVTALMHGLKRLEEGFPLSIRLINEIHSILLNSGRGTEKNPGEFRRSQNWIGGTRPGNAVFVPPPPDKVQECMGKLELFLHDYNQKTPTLIKAALAHVQFETIHPYLDGNGRLGRLLITLLLCSEKVLKEPLLYLSLYIKIHRKKYYKILNEVRFSGDWESWLAFFADAVTHTATHALDTTKKIVKLTSRDSERLTQLKRISGSAHLIHKTILEKPIISPTLIQEKTQLAMTTVNTCLKELENMDIVHEITGQKRNRLYAYTNYIDIINEGTELPE